MVHITLCNFNLKQKVELDFQIKSILGCCIVVQFQYLPRKDFFS